MDDGYVEIGCSIFMKGVILLGYKNIMNAMGMGSDVDVMIYLLLLGEAKDGGQLDKIQ
jgi:hypothetical protein